MSDYTRLYNLTIKDSLPSGNSGKVIKGAELDAEYNAIVSAIASKSDSNSPTFTGTPSAPTASYGTNTTQLATTAFVQAALQSLYPVGSVYINAVVATNPATLLGFGTWVTVGDGRVLVNQDTTDTAFDVLGETIGSKDAIVVSHTHTATSTSTSTVTDAGHVHNYDDAYFAEQTGGTENVAGATGQDLDNEYFYRTPQPSTESATTGVTVATSTATTVASSGVSGTNANIQPSVVVRMWKRTA